jgi:hypothetical protein
MAERWKKLDALVNGLDELLVREKMVPDDRCADV